MSPESEHTPSDPEPSPPQRSPVGTVRWWVAAAAFAGGLLVGVVVAALVIAAGPAGGSDQEGAAGQGAQSTQPSGYSSVPVTAEARVNAACLRVINEAQDVVRILSGSDEAVSDVDLQRLDDIVRRLQPVEARLERDLQQCRVDTDVRSGSTARPASPVPTVPQPTPSQTR